MENWDFGCCLGGGSCCSYKELITIAGSFFFLLFLIVFWLRASVMSLRHCVVAEAGCNWYLRDINIFPFSKEKNLSMVWRIDVAVTRKTKRSYKRSKAPVPLVYMHIKAGENVPADELKHVLQKLTKI